MKLQDFRSFRKSGMNFSPPSFRISALQYLIQTKTHSPAARFLALRSPLVGIGHRQKQQSFFKSNSKHRFCHGGTLRQQRAGRGMRPLSSKEPIHVVFKVNRLRLRFGLRSSQSQKLAFEIIRQYSKKFFVRIDQISLQNDHCHLLVRATRRTHFHHFFRVTAGQIAQRFEKKDCFM